MAGFEIDEPYFIPRNEVKLHPMLAKMIFPWLEDEYAAASRRTGADRDIAAKCFLRLLREFRDVILQVSFCPPFLQLIYHLIDIHELAGCCPSEGHLS